MPRRRRVRKGRAPVGLEEISGGERGAWGYVGPAIAGRVTDLGGREVPAGSVRDNGAYVWASWREWARFYGTVREAWCASRRDGGVGTTAERLYTAFLAGDDLDDVMAQIGEERHARDPRRLFFLQDPRIAFVGQGKRSEPEPA